MIMFCAPRRCSAVPIDTIYRRLSDPVDDCGRVCDVAEVCILVVTWSGQPETPQQYYS